VTGDDEDLKSELADLRRDILVIPRDRIFSRPAVIAWATTVIAIPSLSDSTRK
jgi:hypothetical protein